MGQGPGLINGVEVQLSAVEGNKVDHIGTRIIKSVEEERNVRLDLRSFEHDQNV